MRTVHDIVAYKLYHHKIICGVINSLSKEIEINLRINIAHRVDTCLKLPPHTDYQTPNSLFIKRRKFPFF
jgi:hypothetical protein